MGMDALNRVVRHLREGAGPCQAESLTDGELLQSYCARRDEAAFAALLRRHGPMVLGLCRRILRNEADAEDAFQATFLVLVRKAGAIRRPGMVSNWLYGVAHHTALKAKAMQGKRRAKEMAAGANAAGANAKASAAEEVWRQAQTLVDDALSRLADKYRVPIVLCDLEGKTIKEAARHLGWPQGTVATRLTRGRAELARRLARNGLKLSTGALTALMSQGAMAASVPAALLAATIKAAALFVAGNVTAAGVASATVLALTRGVLNAMLFTKIKLTCCGLMLAAVLGFGLRAGLGAGPKALDTVETAPAASLPADPLRDAAVADEAVSAQDPDDNVAQQDPDDRRAQQRRGLDKDKSKSGTDAGREPASLQARLDALEQQLQALTVELSMLRKGPRPAFQAPPTPAAPPARTEVKIFVLRNAEAGEVAATLKQLLNPDERGGGYVERFGGSTPRTPRLATHQSTNSILVQGITEELEMVETIIIKLDEQTQRGGKAGKSVEKKS